VTNPVTLSECGKRSKSGADKFGQLDARKDGGENRLVKEKRTRTIRRPDPAAANIRSGVVPVLAVESPVELRRCPLAMAGCCVGQREEERDSQVDKLLEMNPVIPEQGRKCVMRPVACGWGLAASSYTFRGLAIRRRKLLSRMPNFFGSVSIGGSSAGGGFLGTSMASRCVRKLAEAYHKDWLQSRNSVRRKRLSPAPYIHAKFDRPICSAACGCSNRGGSFKRGRVLYRGSLVASRSIRRCGCRQDVRTAAEIYRPKKDTDKRILRAWRPRR